MQRKRSGLSFLATKFICPSLHPIYKVHQRIMTKPDKTNFFCNPFITRSIQQDCNTIEQYSRYSITNKSDSILILHE